MQLTTYIKRLLYPLYIYPKIVEGKKKKLHNLFLFYKNKIEQSIDNEQVKIFSNKEEDGIIIRLLASLNVSKGYFLDIGSNDCINSNCANLAFNFDWSGVFVDASKKLLRIGERNYRFFVKKQDLKFVNAFVYPENINEIVKDKVSTLDIDFMNIDIDGNDYAIWAALECVKPKLLIIENKIEYGENDIVVPVHNSFLSSEWGASIVSMTRLAGQKGYTLVATNKDGFNAFYIRNDLLIISGLQELSLKKVAENKHIKYCFYPENVIKGLMEKVEVFKEKDNE